MQALRLVCGKLTDTGKSRQVNEDAFRVTEPSNAAQAASKGALYVVADGMGGNAGGGTASRIAADMITQAYYADPTDNVLAGLQRAVGVAHQSILQYAAQNPALAGMGSTVVAVVIRGQELYGLNVGDSRVYLIGERIEQLSRDHSWVAEELAAGRLTPQQARQHQYRNVITRSLGADRNPEPSFFQRVLQPGETVLLCTDGVNGVLEDERIRSIVAGSPPQTAAEKLILQANAAGGPDNITAVVVRAAPVAAARPAPRAEKTSAWFWIGAGIVILALLVIFILIMAKAASGKGEEGAKVLTKPTATQSRRTDGPRPTPSPVPSRGTVAGDWAPSSALPRKVYHRSDQVIPPPYSATLHGIAYYFGDSPEVLKYGGGMTSEYERQIMGENSECFSNGGGNPEIILPCNMKIHLPSYYLLLVGQVVNGQGENRFALQVGNWKLRVNVSRDIVTVQAGDQIRVLGVPVDPYAPKNDVVMQEVERLERWEDGREWISLLTTGKIPTCGQGANGEAWAWIYTQSTPSTWGLVEEQSGAQAVLMGRKDGFVLLRACGTGAGQGWRLRVSAIYVLDEQQAGYNQVWPGW